MKITRQLEKYVFLFVVFLLSATYCGTVNAELTQADLVVGSGDGLIVRDTDSRLDWLRLTETQGLSVVDVIDDGIGGYADMGFDLASVEQVEELFFAGGVVELNTFIEENFEPVSFLIDLLGCVQGCDGDLSPTAKGWVQAPDLQDWVLPGVLRAVAFPPEGIAYVQKTSASPKTTRSEGDGIFLVRPNLTQEYLEGIWYTENRYFFIDDTGELTNIEPISMEVIHDFLGSFIVNNSYVTGSIYLDHTPSGGIRNDHDINFSGFFASFDEIDIDWDVPGAGTGSETWKRIAYTGNTDQALINTGNVLCLAQGFIKSPKLAGNLRLYYLTGNSSNVDEEIEGSCGGNAQLNGTIDLQSGEFVGTLQYNNYCDVEESSGFSVNGYADFTGQTDLVSKAPLHFMYNFSNLTFVLGDESFSFTGRRGMNYKVSPRVSLFSYVKTDNYAGVSYWVKDYFVPFTKGPDYVEIMSIIGRYYDPVYGYVEPNVEDTILTNDVDEWASSGKMVLAGAKGVQGGDTGIRITYLSATEYLVEADTDGDGAYDDFNSGTLLFSELLSSRCVRKFRGLPWLMLLLD